jgi:hypothetical protein
VAPGQGLLRLPLYPNLLLSYEHLESCPLCHPHQVTLTSCVDRVMLTLPDQLLSFPDAAH